MAGLFCIVLSSGLKALVLYSFLNAVIVCAGLFFMTLLLIKSGRRIFKNMSVGKGQAATGKIERD